MTPLVLNLPPNPHAFEWLNAEQEGDWFEQVFVEPPRFTEIAGLRNAVIYGESGSGKTAVARALAGVCSNAGRGQAWLPVEWKPAIPVQTADMLRTVSDLLADLFAACGESLSRYVFQNPTAFYAAKPWVQESLVSFVRMTHPEDLEIMLYQIQDEIGQENDTLRGMLVNELAKKAFPTNVPHSKQISYLKSLVVGIPGLQGMWVICDGFEDWVQLSPQLVGDTLKAFFSLLNMFEDAEFVFKLVLPTELEPATVAASGILRRRLENFNLKGDPKWLVAIVERRMSSRFGRRTQMQDIFQPQLLCAYLGKYGGQLPRGWLDTIRPFMEAALAKDPPAPLVEEEFKHIRKQYPPRLRVDADRRVVLLGYGEVTPGLQLRLFRILRFLYEERRVCDREELYFLAYQGLKSIPVSAEDKNFQYPKEYNGTLDTALWRLRQQIEMDPANPVYVITQHSQGIRLDNYW